MLFLQRLQPRVPNGPKSVSAAIARARRARSGVNSSGACTSPQLHYQVTTSRKVAGTSWRRMFLRRTATIATKKLGRSW